MQELDRFARFWPDNVGQSENCDRFAAFHEIDRRLATFICLPEEFLQLFGHGDARGLDQRRPSHSKFAPFDAGLHALAGDGLEAVCRRDVEPALLSAPDDSFGDGMLRVPLNCGREPEGIVPRQVVGRGYADHAKFATRESSRLVENNNLDIPSVL